MYSACWFHNSNEFNTGETTTQEMHINRRGETKRQLSGWGFAEHLLFPLLVIVYCNFLVVRVERGIFLPFVDLFVHMPRRPPFVSV